MPQQVVIEIPSCVESEFLGNPDFSHTKLLNFKKFVSRGTVTYVTREILKYRVLV